MLGCGMRSPAAMAEAAAAVRQQTDRPRWHEPVCRPRPTLTKPPCRQRWNAWRRCTPSWACSPSAPRNGAKTLPPSSRRWWPCARQWQASPSASWMPRAAPALGGLYRGAPPPRCRRPWPGPRWGRCGVRQRPGGRRTPGHLPGDFTAAQVGTLALVPQCVDALAPQGVAVIAAGGIMDGRGIGRRAGPGRPGGTDGHGLPGLPRVGHRPGLPRRPGTRRRHANTHHPFSQAARRGHHQRDDGAAAAAEHTWPAYPVHNALMGLVRAPPPKRTTVITWPVGGQAWLPHAPCLQPRWCRNWCRVARGTPPNRGVRRALNWAKPRAAQRTTGQPLTYAPKRPKVQSAAPAP